MYNKRRFTKLQLTSLVKFMVVVDADVIALLVVAIEVVHSSLHVPLDQNAKGAVLN